MEHDFKKIHFIAIGGAVMHNLALALHDMGVEVTGSDDEIFDPSASRLKAKGLLPDQMGWHAERITSGLDAIILGMHAKSDNPELKQAQELGLKIYSFPEFIYEQSRNKQRIVIGGSHGKTTITSMIAHVLKYYDRKFDYLFGAQIEGFENMVHISEDAPIIIIEGDEYPTSPLDSTPKFLHYHHHIGLISGIEWDHVNAFSSYDNYVSQFDKFADSSPKGGTLIFTENDDSAIIVGRKERTDVTQMEYGIHPHKIKDGRTYLVTRDGAEIPIELFGQHNMENINGAKTLLNRIAITNDQFYKAIATFKGASNRLEKISASPSTIVYKDFAHSPSKLRATVKAVGEQFPQRKLLAVMELHTYSSMTKKFLKEYRDAFAGADEAIVFYDPHAAALKRLPELSEEEIKTGFNNSSILVFNNSEKLKKHLLSNDWISKNLLLMSSGNYGGLDVKKLAEKITSA